MRVVFSQHAEKRLHQNRQNKINRNDVIELAKSVPGKCKTNLKVSNNKMSIILVDKNENKRLIISIIGR